MILCVRFADRWRIRGKAGRRSIGNGLLVTRLREGRRGLNLERGHWREGMGRLGYRGIILLVNGFVVCSFVVVSLLWVTF